MNQKDIVEAIKQTIERYPHTSEEHILALLELYGNNKVKKLKRLIVDNLKDLAETPQIEKNDVKKLIENILNINV